MLKHSEREKIQDCLLLIQSASNILSGMRSGVVPELGDLLKCFEDADQRLNHLLRT